MRPREVVVHPDAAMLAQAVAARLLTRLLDVQSVRRPAHLGVTGGTIGTEILAAVAASPLRDAVDWTGVHVWWGDERFLPAGDPERNETLARRALIEPLGDALPAENLHPMAAAGNPGIASPEDAAAAYARELAAFAAGPVDTPAAGVPAFDILMFGMGPDGHIASLFPGNPALEAVGTPVVGVHGSPKPPPERISLTFEAIRAAREVWVVAAGASKRPAIAAALGGEPADHLPVVGAVGHERTLWLIDTDATPPD
ncbi:MAG: 6-phosphogluconolactonase [Cellulomonas sp.]